ncbi:MAG: L,D-transpeptidase [Deltaproteobacteria bacterium]|nr:L,D-transpeptidase [Deltaproteobacteria bacterium]
MLWRLTIGAIALLLSGSVRAACERPQIHINKSQGKLLLACDGRPRLTIDATFGLHPKGHKQRSGDERTPEGVYRICERHRSKKHYLFFGLDYPRPADAERGLAAGLISKRQYQAIIRAHQRGRCPPWGTRLGGAIGIHGVNAERAWLARAWQKVSRIGKLHRNVGFTDGCILIDNDATTLLWQATRVGTPVVIHPQR